MAAFPRSRYILFGTLVVVGLTSDLWTKSKAFAQLGYPGGHAAWYGPIRCLWGEFSVDFTTNFNEGALFGIGQGQTWLFALLSFFAIGFVIYWLFVRAEAKSWYQTATLALIMAGTLGNLYDRLYLHHCVDGVGRAIYGVRDFIDCTIPIIRWNRWLDFELVAAYRWPIFNLADSFLVTGAILLTGYTVFAPVRTAAEAEPLEISRTATLPHRRATG